MGRYPDLYNHFGCATGMNRSTRKKISAALLLGSIAIALWAWRCGLGFIGYQSRQVPMLVWFGVSIHWPVLPVSAVASAGLLCWFLSLRSDEEKRPSLERSLFVAMVICIVLGLLQIGVPLRCWLERRACDLFPYLASSARLE